MRVHFPALLMAAAAFSTHAADLSGDCKPVFAAMEKSLQADHTTTSVHGKNTMRGVTVGGAVYLQMNGAWRKSPMTAQQIIAMARENLKDAKAFTCKPLPDAVVDGVAVANFATRTVTDDDTTDTTVAIAKATGLAVRVQNKHAGDADADLVTSYGYTGVKAPI